VQVHDSDISGREATGWTCRVTNKIVFFSIGSYISLKKSVIAPRFLHFPSLIIG
jgi:hypothetical protein